MKERQIKINNSERFPLLVDNSGMPFFAPNQYLLTMCRTNDAFNTLRAKARAVTLLYNFFELADIDIEDRFKKGQLLLIPEIHSLCDFLRLHNDSIVRKNDVKNNDITVPKNKVIPYKLPVNNDKYIDNDSYNIRLVFVIKYLVWLVSVMTQDIHRSHDRYTSTMLAKDEMIRILSSRKIKKKYRLRKKGMISGNAEEFLVNIIDPNNKDNPFRGKFVRVRNEVYILLSLMTGLRRGMMLKIKCEHVDLVTNELDIVRSPDDPHDTRVHEPNVKTGETTLHIDEQLANLFKNYKEERNKLKKARKHPYFFVSSFGNPLSEAQAGKIYIMLRNKFPDVLPENLSQHLIRHYWNEKFSRIAKEKNLNSVLSDNIRKNIMTWSQNSEMPDLYNEVFIQEESRKADMSVQNGVMKLRKKAKDQEES